MKIEMNQPSKVLLTKYDELSITFTANTVFELKHVDGFNLSFKEVEVPEFTKDFDVHEKPSDLLNTFDISNWKVITVYKEDILVGGAILAYQTKEINMLEGRDDLVVVWDIRINSDYRRLGIGKMIFDYIKEWAMTNNVTRIKVESQNNNVKACKFYESQGGTISNINKYIYKEYPEEIQIIWSIKVGEEQ